MSNLFFKKVNLAIMKNFNQSSLARFFTRFPKLLFAGLMYSIPFAVFSGIFILISFLSGFNNVILWSLGIINFQRICRLPDSSMFVFCNSLLRNTCSDRHSLRLCLYHIYSVLNCNADYAVLCTPANNYL